MRGQRCNAADSDDEQAGTRASALGASLAAAPSLTGQEPRAASSARWWSPGDGRILAATAAYDNRFGTLRSSTRPARSRPRTCVLRTHRPQRARVRDVPSARRRHERVGGHHRGAVARDERTGSDFCGNRRQQLSEPPAGRRRVAFAALEARPVPRPSALASQARGWHAGRARVHYRSGARSDWLQHPPGIWIDEQVADGLGVPASPPGGQPQIRESPTTSVLVHSSAKTASRRRAIPRAGSRSR